MTHGIGFFITISLTRVTPLNMENIKHFLQKLPPWILSIVCFLAICWLTLASKPLGDNDIPLFPGADKIAHAIMFGGFTLCIIIDSLRSKGWPSYPANARIFLYAPDLPCIMGIATEILQREMHAGRSFELGDMISDITGAFLVAIGFFLFQYYNAKNKTS